MTDATRAAARAALNAELRAERGIRKVVLQRCEVCGQPASPRLAMMDLCQRCWRRCTRG